MNNTHASTLFLDSVIIDEIQRYSWLVSGVTTTPTFFKRENIDYDTFVMHFRTQFPYLELHIEALSSTPSETEKQIKDIINKDWFDRSKVILKIPATLPHLEIISRYTKEGILFNTHLVFNPAQAYLAAKAGTAYVCPLIGRYADTASRKNPNFTRGGDNDAGKLLLSEVMSAVHTSDQYNNVKVMASSIRTIEDFRNAILLKAHAITVPTKILEQAMNDELTHDGISIFLKDMGY